MARFLSFLVMAALCASIAWAGARMLTRLGDRLQTSIARPMELGR